MPPRPRPAELSPPGDNLWHRTARDFALTTVSFSPRKGYVLRWKKLGRSGQRLLASSGIVRQVLGRSHQDRFSSLSFPAREVSLQRLTDQRRAVLATEGDLMAELALQVGRKPDAEGALERW